MIEDYADALPKALADERFAFFGKALSGKTEQRPRWQGGVAMVSSKMDETGDVLLAGRGVLGDAVGQMYAQRYFSPETKAQIEAMVANIIAAVRRRIEALSWMDPATKAEVSFRFTPPAGPVTRRSCTITPATKSRRTTSSAISGAAAWLIITALSPVSAIPWIAESGACILPSMLSESAPQNALNFPAAYFQPPFFDPQAPDAVNYG